MRSRRLAARRDAVESGKTLAQILQDSLGLWKLLELVIGVTQLEHRVRQLVAVRVLVDDILEFNNSLIEVTRYVIGFTEPVLRISGISAIGKFLEKCPQVGFGFFVPALFQRIESRLVSRLFFTLSYRTCRCCCSGL